MSGVSRGRTGGRAFSSSEMTVGDSFRSGGDGDGDGDGDGEMKSDLRWSRRARLAGGDSVESRVSRDVEGCDFRAAFDLVSGGEATVLEGGSRASLGSSLSVALVSLELRPVGSGRRKADGNE